MLNIAVCDDESAEISYITALVQEWSEARGTAAQLSVFRSAEALLFAERSFDILLLDVQMGGMDGVTLARRVREGDRAVQIIFVSGYTEYIADGYEVEALHYLLKPVTAEKLCSVLDRAASKLERNERSILVSSGGETVRIPLYEILFIEVQRNLVTIHADRDYAVKRTLAELERELDDGFFRVGRSHIVSLRHVRRVTRTEAWLSDSVWVPLSRGMYTPLNRALIERL